MTATPAWRAASAIVWLFPQPEGPMSAITPGVSLRRKETIFAAAIAPAREHRWYENLFLQTSTYNCRA